MTSTAANDNNELQVGYVLVPLNATTRLFLSQFASVDIPPSSVSPNKNNNKKKRDCGGGSSIPPRKKLNNSGGPDRLTTFTTPPAGVKSKPPSGPGVNLSGVTKELGATVLSGGRSGDGRHGASFPGVKSKPPSGPGVNLSGVTKELGATVLPGRSVGGRHGVTCSGVKSKPPSGPGINLPGVTKELGATVVARRSLFFGRGRTGGGWAKKRMHPRSQLKPPSGPGVHLPGVTKEIGATVVPGVAAVFTDYDDDRDDDEAIEQADDDDDDEFDGGRVDDDDKVDDDNDDENRVDDDGFKAFLDDEAIEQPNGNDDDEVNGGVVDNDEDDDDKDDDDNDNENGVDDGFKAFLDDDEAIEQAYDDNDDDDEVNGGRVDNDEEDDDDNHDDNDDDNDDDDCGKNDDPAGGQELSFVSLSTSLSSINNLDEHSVTTISMEERPCAPALPIISSFAAPKYTTMTLPHFSYNANTAPSPQRDSVITFETMNTKGEIDLRPDAFASKGIISLQSYVKRGRGLLWQNHSSCKLHYETSNETLTEIIVPKAKRLGIRHNQFYPDGGKVHKVLRGDNAFVIISGGTFEDFHEKVCFRDLIRDACIPAPHTIPTQDSVRRNSGPSVGLASSQGTRRSTHDAFAVPSWIKGTPRYSKVFGLISETTKSLLSSQGLSYFLPPSEGRACRKQLAYQRRCEELCDGNLYLALSFKIYVHNPNNIDNHEGYFNAHRDVHNPDHRSPNDIFFSAWDTWFEPLLNLYVTGTIIACGRRSQEELYDRMFLISRATAEILERSKKLPVSERIIHPSIICPPTVEYTVRGCHLLQVHALTPNDYIYQLSQLLGGRRGLSAFLATEVIVAFHQTSNNSLRFHRFMCQLLSNVKKHGDLRFLGSSSVVEGFQKYCFGRYGSFDGVTDRMGVKEGVVRHQSCSSCPVSHFENLRALQILVMHLENASKGSCCNDTYSLLVKAIKAQVIGFGDLKSQKAVMTFASLGLFIQQNFLGFFSTGSTQQLKNLKQEPFAFSRSEQVTQLRRKLLIDQPQLLPMQADEYICTLSSNSTKRTAAGEVYYRYHSIFNATRRMDGSVAMYRYSWSKKVNEAAPQIQFDYSRDPNRNHYVPSWAACGNEEPPSNPFVSLCSMANIQHKNTYRLKSSSALDFIEYRTIQPTDFQTLLYEGSYVVIPDLMEEVSVYLGCTVPELSKRMRLRRSANKRGSTVEVRVDLTQLSSTPSKMVYATGSDSAKTTQAALIEILLMSHIREKPRWFLQFFNRARNSHGFLLLVPTSSPCLAYCLVAAFIYIDNLAIKCCRLDEKGNSGPPFQLATMD